MSIQIINYEKRSLIGILILLVAFSMTYAKIKATEAEVASTDVQLLIQESERLSEEAVQLIERAIKEAANARMAEVHALDLSEQLKKCQSK
jgi:hypothetical protein